MEMLQAIRELVYAVFKVLEGWVGLGFAIILFLAAAGVLFPVMIELLQSMVRSIIRRTPKVGLPKPAKAAATVMVVTVLLMPALASAAETRDILRVFPFPVEVVWSIFLAIFALTIVQICWLARKAPSDHMKSLNEIWGKE